jgi:hypothetical protein
MPASGMATTCQSRSTLAELAVSGAVRMVSQTAQANRSVFNGAAPP